MVPTSLLGVVPKEITRYERDETACPQEFIFVLGGFKPNTTATKEEKKKSTFITLDHQQWY
jgi:hypothetical protein